LSKLEQLENTVRKDSFPLCKITITKNTKDFNYEIVTYEGVTKEQIDEEIIKAIHGVKGMHNEIRALKKLNEEDEWK
jgi:hypothetical protein